MISSQTLRFLKELKKNNNREWFNRNKSRFNEAADDFQHFIRSLIAEIARFDNSVIGLEPKDCVFRIYRDVRFSKDKSPYKTNFGAHIVAGGKKSENRAGYYFHLCPGDSFLGGGAYMPSPEWLSAIRKEIHYNSGPLKKLTRNKDFLKTFGEVNGEKLSRPPAGYEKDHPEMEWLKLKSFTAIHPISDKDVQSKTLLQDSVKAFKTLRLLNDYLNQSLD